MFKEVWYDVHLYIFEHAVATLPGRPLRIILRACDLLKPAGEKQTYVKKRKDTYVVRPATQITTL